MAATKCCIPGCNVNKKNDSNVHLFNFTNKRCEEWIKWIESMTNMDFIPTKYSKICEKHFQKSDFHKTPKKLMLHPHVIPSIFHQIEAYPKNCTTTMVTKINDEYPRYTVNYNENGSVKDIRVLDGKCAFTHLSNPETLISIKERRFFFTEGKGQLILVSKGGRVEIDKENDIKVSEENTEVKEIQKNRIIDLESNISRMNLIPNTDGILKTINPYKRDYSHNFAMYDKDGSSSKPNLKMYHYYSSPVYIKVLTGRYCFIYHDERCTVYYKDPRYVYSIKGTLREITLESGGILKLSKATVSIPNKMGKMKDIERKDVKEFEDGTTSLCIQYKDLGENVMFLVSHFF